MSDDLDSLRARIEELELHASRRRDLASLIVTSCSKDVLEPLSRIVSTLAALELDVQIFFTGWGVCLFGDDVRSSVDPGGGSGFRDMIRKWREANVKLFACGESCDVHLPGTAGATMDALLEPGGLTSFLDRAVDGRMTLVL